MVPTIARHSVVRTSKTAPVVPHLRVDLIFSQRGQKPLDYAVTTILVSQVNASSFEGKAWPFQTFNKLLSIDRTTTAAKRADDGSSSDLLDLSPRIYTSPSTAEDSVRQGADNSTAPTRQRTSPTGLWALRLSMVHSVNAHNALKCMWSREISANPRADREQHLASVTSKAGIGAKRQSKQNSPQSSCHSVYSAHRVVRI